MKFLKKNTLILVILFAVGIIFLFLSEYDGNKETGVNASNDFNEKAYITALEEELCAIIEKMNGVEDVHVMITLKGGERYLWAEEVSKSYDGNKSNSQSSLIFAENAQGVFSPILTAVAAPDIKGVSVVCKGAENPSVCERITKLIASTLNLNVNQIYVTQ